ncbi:pantoate--beta-alanine ligase [Pontivivens insulae]|uniref:Pantothenate synthetase n=1 Tax=Pontivivens insulae TaxID=1639689 RepID=A0A2R8A9K2_9RHOB|nr:pantoate--beta-alanine ligase [Pontivivens insulae]RED18810.1 pantothenate synthetase [Pontivivens insulae]SPF28708.1 Pantothenate synthetase [Pontivivens insulae]
MEICKSVAEIRAIVANYRRAGERVGLVTTMGALHEGHLTLMRAARRDNDRVIATIFVNPTQFGEVADLAHYPSDDIRDINLLEAEGVDALFLPEVATIYPPGDDTIVETVTLANMLHGKVRPGHFRGVATVVARLFNITLPDAAYFGEKDYQQLQVIRRMTNDLHFPIEIHAVPTVREPDGLAMSSRNVRLTPEDRAEAVVLSRALMQAQELVAAGTTVEALAEALRRTIKASPRATLRGLDIVEAETLSPLSGPVDRKIAILISAEFGGVLLIDQCEVSP